MHKVSNQPIILIGGQGWGAGMAGKQRLDVLLVDLGLVETRQKAQAEIMAGNVLVNDTPAVKAGQFISIEATIRLRYKFPYVSRGALKLIHALERHKIELKDRIAVDIGASTGGFTQVLLEKGARMVYAVDVGTNQLDWKLRNDPRVVVRENTNARYLDNKDFQPAPSIAVMDVSFISLTKVLEPVSNILEGKKEIIALIKPQFELDKDKIGDKGLVPEEYRSFAVERVIKYAESIGLKSSEILESPIAGAKSGNIEYLVLFTKES